MNAQLTQVTGNNLYDKLMTDTSRQQNVWEHVAGNERSDFTFYYQQWTTNSGKNGAA